jgi:hypothetical protein
MPQVIRLKNSNATGSIPLIGDMVLGEVAVNTFEGRMFVRVNDGSDKVIEIGEATTTLDGQSAAYYLDYPNFTNTPTIDSSVIDASTNSVQGNAVFDALALKEDSLGFTAEDAANKGAINGYASLGADQKIPTSQLPALAITQSFVVASEVAQLALTAEEGDVAIRSDLSQTFIHNGGVAGTIADWNEMLTPTDVVLSVNGQTGAITVTTSDINEGTNLYYTNARVLTYVGGTLDDAGTGATDFWSASKIATHIDTAIANNNSINANRDPLATDDSAADRYVGQTWINNVSDEVFISVDVSVGVAVWLNLSTASGATNLSYTPSASNGTVVSDTGTNAIIPLATSAAGSNLAGLMSPAQFDRLAITIINTDTLDGGAF